MPPKKILCQIRRRWWTNNYTPQQLLGGVVVRERAGEGNMNMKRPGRVGLVVYRKIEQGVRKLRRLRKRGERKKIFIEAINVSE